MSVTLQSLRELRALLDSLRPTCNDGALSDRPSDPNQKLHQTGEAVSDNPLTTLPYDAECSISGEMASGLPNGRALDIPVSKDSITPETGFSDT